MLFREGAPSRDAAPDRPASAGLCQGLGAWASGECVQKISWRKGTNDTLSGRFAAVRVRQAGSNIGKARLHPAQWLLIEWPANEVEPLKYYLSTLPEDTALNELVPRLIGVGALNATTRS